MSRCLRGALIAGLGGLAACHGGEAVAPLFQEPVDYPVAPSASSMVAADFDGDGDLDLAVGSANDADAIGVVSILLGDGRGGFTAGATYPAGLAVDLAQGDFDGDGHVDLATSSYDGQGPLPFSVLFGAGDGTFRLERYSSDVVWRGGIDAADLDEDGRSDLALPYNEAEDGGLAGIAILLGPDFTQRLEAGVVAAKPTLADVDGDGHVDLLTTAGVQRGDGHGGLAPPVLLIAPDAPLRFRVADLDGDGDRDLAFSAAEPRIDVLLGDGAGHFEPARTYPVATSRPLPLDAADLDGDGALDLVVGGGRDGDPVDDTISILLGDGAGGFAAPAEAHVTTGAPNALVAADLNGDGAPDLVGNNSDGAAISVLLNTR